jgi:hypothetical protein
MVPTLSKPAWGAVIIDLMDNRSDGFWTNSNRHARMSVLAAAARLGIPVTVHVALGTAIIHMDPAASGRALVQPARFHVLRSYKTPRQDAAVQKRPKFLFDKMRYSSILRLLLHRNVSSSCAMTS